MAYVPGFEHDVFVSYAHADDIDLFEKGKGWVARFDRALQVDLQRRLNKDEFTMWRDSTRLMANYAFGDEIARGVEKAAVFLALHSPAYVDSDYCLAELEHFVTTAQASGQGDRLGNATRIFRADLDVLRPEQKVPDSLDPINIHRFYEVDEKNVFTGRLDEGKEYEQAVKALARQVGDFLLEMKRVTGTPLVVRAPTGSDSNAVQTGPTVFLACPTPDLAEQSNALRDTLIQYGVTVLDGHSTITGEGDTQDVALDAIREQTDQFLGSSVISVHMVGSKAGPPLPGDLLNPSLDRLHYRSAVRLADADGSGTPASPSLDSLLVAKGPRVLVWTPAPVIGSLKSQIVSNGEGVDERQLAFLADLKDEPSGQVEWLQQGFQELLDQCFTRLEIDRSAQFNGGFGAGNFGPDDPYVFLHAQPQARDREEFKRILECLERSGCQCEWEFCEDAPLPAHASNYDGLLILHLDSPGDWATKRMKQAAELVRRRKKFVAAVYDGPCENKEDLEFGSTLVPVYPQPRKGPGEFDCTVLKNFLERLQRSAVRA